MKKIAVLVCVILLLLGSAFLPGGGAAVQSGKQQKVQGWATVVEAGRSSYGYHQLDTRLRRTYDDILSAALAYEQNVATPAVTGEEISEVMLWMSRDCPVLFWLAENYSYREPIAGTSHITLQFSHSEEIVKRTLREIEDAAVALLKGISPELSDFDKALICHDRLLSVVEYDLKAPNQQEVYGAICKGRATCEGYARSYQYLLTRMGLETLIVYGTAGEAHAWNMVQLAGNYYHADPTWGDRKLEDGTAYLSHEYLFLNDETFYKTHTPYTDGKNYKLPVCDTLEQSYFTKKQLIAQNDSVDELTEKLKAALELSLAEKNAAFQISFGNPVLANKVRDKLESGKLDQAINGICTQKKCGKIIGRIFNKNTAVLTYILQETEDTVN